MTPRDSKPLAGRVALVTGGSRGIRADSAVVRFLGRLDILVNNAGVAGPEAAFDTGACLAIDGGFAT